MEGGGARLLAGEAVIVPRCVLQRPLRVEDSIPGIMDTIASQAGNSGLWFLDRAGHEVRW